MLSAENKENFSLNAPSTQACWWTSPATRCPMGRQRAGSGAGPRQRRLPPAVPGAPLRLRHRPHRRTPVRPSADRSCQRHCPIGPLGVTRLAASGLPLPTSAESSCRRPPRVNTVGVCADEPPAWRPAGYRAGLAVRRRPGPLAGRLGETIAALHQLPHTEVMRQHLPTAEGPGRGMAAVRADRPTSSPPCAGSASTRSPSSGVRRRLR